MKRPPSIDAPTSEPASEIKDTTLRLDSESLPKELPLDFLSPTTRPDALGRLGHYEVLEVLGLGGFGIVLRAFDETLQRVVAVKVLTPELAATSPARKRFLREARASAQVRHDNVVQVHAIEEVPLPYLVMEYIPGDTLQQRMEAVGPLSPDDAVRIATQIARGLSAAHERGLIHRDVKPGNVILENGPEGRVKLTDFGLARAADDASLTQSGMVAGTPQYMAPEQAYGEALDQRTDLFSLGSVLYAMVTGRPPFRATNSMAVLKRVCEDTPRPIREIIPEVPQWLCDVVTKLHAKKPAERFQSAREVVEALTNGAAGPPPTKQSSARATARKLVLAGCIAVVGLNSATAIYISSRGTANSAVDDGAKPDNSTPAATPAPNMALMFDGREHSAIAETLVRDEDTPVTLECWLKMFAPTPTYRTVVALGGKHAVWIANSPDTVAPVTFRIPAAPDNFRQFGGKIRFGSWMHVALVYDQRETRFYVDGKLQAANPRVDPPVKMQRWPVGGLIIGSGRYEEKGQPTFPGQFVGQLDEIRVSKIARYEEEFTPQRRFELDPNTLALYHCDEGGGEILADTSANKHHVTIKGANWVKVGP